jgi:SAM-dependent methyltransferase
MTTITHSAIDTPTGSRPPAALFAITVFASATLVFLVEPMVAKLVLPLLGGSPSVWNTSLAFFQAALLLGYAYAHGLQRIGSIKLQGAVHCVALLIAAAVLPLRIHEVFGPPSSLQPNLWLLGVLAASIGAPFAVLSATAPLVQAWHARLPAADGDKETHTLYAASNLGSLLALLAYPLVVEPTLTVRVQTLGWSAIYAGFFLLMAGLAVTVSRASSGRPATVVAPAAAVPAVSWKDRLAWITLAAIPSSLMLGVTNYITTDIASAPFLWVVPLALYLLSFIIAFQERPALSRELTLTLQGAALAACVTLLPHRMTFFVILLVVHLGCFFLTALMCHQTLVARRPPPARLTEFYLLMSVGGVIGGGFNAFVAPVIFDNVWEYPLVLVLACLARPWGHGTVPRKTWVLMAIGIAAALASPIINTFLAPHIYARPVVGGLNQIQLTEMILKLTLAVAAVSAFMLRSRALIFLAVLAALSVGTNAAADKVNTSQTWRSFFGVLRQSQTSVPGIGQVRMLSHGTTLHGGQALDPKWACHPLVYYAHTTPIGQVFDAVQLGKPAIRIGAVGLGTGSVSAYVRPADRLTFFEIDPLVVRISSDPAHFSYTTRCAKGPIDYVLGDARLTVAKQPAETFDILLIDAFSSDAVPAHLLTVEAVRGYLTHLKPDGVLILHLSNRNLDLKGPAQAVAKAAGGVALLQDYRPKPNEITDWAAPEDALIVGRSQAALDRFAGDTRWKPAATTVRPWTDDYTNLAGALWRRMVERIRLGQLG